MIYIYTHCRLFPGGAYNVLYDLILEDISQDPSITQDIYIYTTISDQTHMPITHGGNTYMIPVITTLPRRLNTFFNYIQKKQIPLLKSIFDYRNLIVFAPRLIAYMSKQLRDAKPTHVTTSSFALCKNIELPSSVTHSTLYLHSPMQYIHSHAQEYNTKIRGRKGWIWRKIAPYLTRRDTKQRPGYDTMYANSMYTARLAYDIYGRTCLVKYPQIHIGKVVEKNILADILQQSDISTAVSEIITDNTRYYIYIGRVVSFVKEVDRIVKLFNQTGDTLLILGSGPDEVQLKTQAHKNIHFLGWSDNTDLKTSLLSYSSGLINITKESYGLVTAEAVALGVPVFGYNQGGSVELVTQGKGLLVESKEHDVLVKEWEKFGDVYNDT